MTSLTRLGVLGLFSIFCFTLGACRVDDRPVIRDSGNAISRAKADVARGERAPQAAAADSAPKPGEGLPYPGTWTPTITYRDSLFTIERPGSSTAESRPAAPSYGRPHRDVIIGRLPECRWSCAVTVEVWRDTAGGGMAELVRSLTTADTADGALDRPATIIDSLPLGPVAAVHLDTDCGDCASRIILTAHRGWMAKIEYASDDREGNSPILTAHLAALARSFRWR
jgi:hypothetical protein